MHFHVCSWNVESASRHTKITYPINLTWPSVLSQLFHESVRIYSLYCISTFDFVSKRLPFALNSIIQSVNPICFLNPYMIMDLSLFDELIPNSYKNLNWLKLVLMSYPLKNSSICLHSMYAVLEKVHASLLARLPRLAGLASWNSSTLFFIFFFFSYFSP